MIKSLLFHFAKRYIAGESRSSAIEAAKRLNSAGIDATIDNLGEEVKKPFDAREAVTEYLLLLDDIKEAAVKANVSLKLSHMGLSISKEIAGANVEEVVKKAASLGIFVWFDMEGSKYTEDTISIFLDINRRYPSSGIAIQSYLFRSAKDVKTLIEKKAAVRLVKGAYKEPPAIAFAVKKDVDKNFSLLMKELLLKGRFPAIATHDEKLIEEAVRFSAEKNIKAESLVEGIMPLEFQMLLGIKRSLQKKLVAEGYPVRVYVPYGRNWLAYSLRRLRERKENIFFILKNIFD